MKKGLITLLTGALLAGLFCFIPVDEVQAAEAVTLEVKGDAYWSDEEKCYVLTEERAYQSGAVVFSNIKCNSDFDVSFEYYSGEEDIATRDSYKGADGIGFSFYSDTDNVGTWESISNGYTVEIDTYYETNNAAFDPQYNHVAITKDGYSKHLGNANASTYTEDGKWHSMNVKTVNGVTTVYVDGNEVLKQENIVASKYDQMMISAFTGAGYNKQKVRNIVVNKAEHKTAQSTSNVKIGLTGDAYYSPEEDCIILTQEETWQGGAVTFPEIKCNYDFDLSFDFYTGDSDIAARDSYKGADGIVVEFYCNMEINPNQGGDIYFSGRGGYGVEIDTYYETNNAPFDPQYNHIAFIKDTTENHLVYADATAYTEDSKWHHIQIKNDVGVCKVYVDGAEVLRQSNVYPTGYYTMGISAATGAGKNWHKVKNIVLAKAIDNPAGRFEDIKPDDYFYDPILWAGGNGITAGKDDQTFAPSEICTRAQMVTFLWSTMGKPEPKISSVPFVDVQDRSRYFYKPILWAYENKVAAGVSATEFKPYDIVTRGQVVTFLYALNGKPAPAKMSQFSDVPSNFYYYKPVSWAVAQGITAGKGKNMFGPEDPCTRGQIVTFIYKGYK